MHLIDWIKTDTNHTKVAITVKDNTIRYEMGVFWIQLQHSRHKLNENVFNQESARTGWSKTGKVDDDDSLNLKS